MNLGRKLNQSIKFPYRSME